MTDKRTITADQADEILDLSYGAPGEKIDDLTFVATQEDDPRRWMQGVTIIVSDPDGAFWGLDYDRGLTENQESHYPWRGSWGGERKDVKLTRLYAHTITTVDYRTTAPKVGA